jgi:protein O-GlcNAcase/histone acetyltransferase
VASESPAGFVCLRIAFVTGAGLPSAIDTPAADTSVAPAEFLAGVIEGFYGPPWSARERAALFAQMAAWGMNSYLYAPKDDLKHRALWREPYSTDEAAVLAQLISLARSHRLRFIFALAPGLDVRYGDSTDFDHVAGRFKQLIALGCRDFALLFDDIPDRLSAADQARWDSFAEAQCALTNRLHAWLREQIPGGLFLFCPTPYCGRMAKRELGGRGYLEIIGRQLASDIRVFWTGPEIISREITIEHVRWVAKKLRRKPLLWDNLHANDYDGRRFFCGPYAGRESGIRAEVGGILTNPNTEFPLNHVALRTCAEFVLTYGAWDARAAYLRAINDWHEHFATVGQPVTREDLVLLGDAFYLPHEDGPEATRLFHAIAALLTAEPARWLPAQVAAFVEQATRLRDCCARLAELRDRPLFHALSRRVWELREELDLLLHHVRSRSNPATAAEPVCSDFHLPGTYRGGFVARLQQLLEQEPDGQFRTNVPTRSRSNPGVT